MRRKITDEDWKLISLLFFGTNTKIILKNKESEQVLKNASHGKHKNVFIYTDTEPFIPSIQYDCFLDLHGALVMDGLDKTSKNFLYICNPDHTVRWLFPDDIKSPSYLNFYARGSSKGNIYKMGSKILFKIGLSNLLCDGSFKLYQTGMTQLETVANNLQHDQYSVFMGTVGPLRTMLIEVYRNNSITHFIKVPTSIEAIYSLENEHHQLSKLKQINLQSTVVPSSYQFTDHEVTAYSFVKPKQIIKSTDWQPQHDATLREIISKTLSHQEIKTLSLWKKLVTQLQWLQESNDFKFETYILEAAVDLLQSIDNGVKIPTALAHGDFTPWNIYVHKDGLHIYNWEYSQDHIPLLFDAFHYLIQKEMLIYHTPAHEIKQIVDTWTYRTETIRLTSKYNVDIRLNYRLYLITNFVHHLSIFQKQAKLDPQVYRLITVWTYLMNEELQRNKHTLRKELQEDSMSFMHNKPYTLMHNINNTNDWHLGTDVDIAMSLKNTNHMFQRQSPPT